nr:ParB/RepB/Spo0J family partition protein [Kocuria turfanensis]
MGEALRNTTLVSRPSDMFFLPSGAPTGPSDPGAPSGRPAGETVTGGAADTADGAADTRGDGSRTHADEPASPADDVSRETSPHRGQRPPAPNAQASSPSDGVDPEFDGGVDADSHVSRETEALAEGLTAVPGARFAEIAVGAIHPNRKQPRQVFDEEELAELAYSIGELGVLQPIVVRPSREDGETSYELVMGERRWRATRRAGLSTIPAIVRETSDDDLLRDALLENLHRSQLNPLEEAAAYQQLMEEFGTTQEELSRRIGRSRPQISNTIRLLRLPPLVQRRVAAGVLSSGHARALLSLADPAEMERLAQRIVAEGLSVRATEEAVALTEGTERKTPRAAAPAGRHKERLDYIAEAFADRLDTSVKIALGARKGKMTIEFASVEDLNRIIEVLDPGIERS